LITNTSYFELEKKEAEEIKQKVISTNVSSISNNSASSGTGVTVNSGGISGGGYSTGINYNTSGNSFGQNTQGVFSIKKDDANPFNNVNKTNPNSVVSGVGNSYDNKQPFKSANMQKLGNNKPDNFWENVDRGQSQDREPVVEKKADKIDIFDDQNNTKDNLTTGNEGNNDELDFFAGGIANGNPNNDEFDFTQVGRTTSGSMDLLDNFENGNSNNQQINTHTHSKKNSGAEIEFGFNTFSDQGNHSNNNMPNNMQNNLQNNMGNMNMNNMNMGNKNMGNMNMNNMNMGNKNMGNMNMNNMNMGNNNMGNMNNMNNMSMNNMNMNNMNMNNMNNMNKMNMNANMNNMNNMNNGMFSMTNNNAN